MGNLIVGLDIGTSKVCTIIGEGDKNGELHIVGIGYYPCSGVKKGVIVDIDETAYSIKKSVEQAERMANQKISSVYLKIYGGLTTIYKNNGVVAVSREDREITKQDVDRVLQAAKIIAIPSDKEIIDVIPLEYIVDGYGEIKDPIGMAGIRLEVNAAIVTGSVTAIQNMEKCIKKAGLEVEGIIVGPLATGEAVLLKDEKELGVALIDVGAGVTDISVFKDGKIIYSSMIAVGGWHITNDLSVGLKISFEEAENIKKKYGTLEKLSPEKLGPIKIASLAGKTKSTTDVNEISDIIEARVSELLMLVYERLEEAKVLEDIVTNVVITGGGISFLKGNLELAQKIFNRNIRIGSPQNIGVATPIYSAGVGVVKYVYNNKRFMHNVQSTDKKEKKGSKLVDKLKEIFSDFWA
ncbi:cell division protein FtsA [Thermoanaerobacter uzonensis]|uniref:cell division protein FtsA n=1 Tax=Thermoanaerobacter uzonensis TaxID=447593 RepID=UPI003D767DD9